MNPTETGAASDQPNSGPEPEPELGTGPLRSRSGAALRLRAQNVAAHSPTAVDRALVTKLVYFLAVLASCLLAVSIVDEGLVPTLLAAAGTCAVVTLLLLPGRRAASLGIFISITLALSLRNYSELDPAARGWAFANMVVLLSPFATIPLRRTKGFPFLHLWCLVETIYVYVSSLLSRPTPAHAYLFPPEVRETGYRTLLWFTLTLVVCGSVLVRTLAPRMSKAEGDAFFNSPDRSVTTKSIPRAYVLMLGATVFLAILTVTGFSAQLGTFTEAIRGVTYAGGLILAMLWLDGQLRVAHKIVLLGAAGALALEGLGSGALYQSAIPAFLFLALVLSHRRRVPWAMLIAAILVVVVLNVNKGEFRAENWAQGQASNSGSTDLGIAYLQKTSDNLDSANQEQISSAANRFGNSDLLGYTATWVPERYPYYGYKAYTSLPVVLIPRAILPDKGSFNQANEFGRQYELIARSDVLTTVNTPLHVEAYVSGGLFFMVFIAGLSGLLLAFFGFLLRSGNPAATIAGCALIYQIILTIESGILDFMIVIPFMAFYVPILWWACMITPTTRRRNRAGPTDRTKARFTTRRAHAQAT